MAGSSSRERRAHFGDRFSMKRRNLLLLPAALILVGMARSTVAQIQHGHHATPSPQRYSLEILIGDGPSAKAVRVPVELASSTAPAELRQRIELPSPLVPVFAREFLPHAELRQEVAPSESSGGHAMTLLSIEGPEQSYTRWLVDGDPERNRLISLVGTWRFMVVENREKRDQLWTDFSTELRRPPMLRVRSIDGGKETRVRADTGEVHDLPDLGGQVIIREFYSHYAMSDKTNKPVNVSPKRVNPAVLVELRSGGRSEQRWVFSQFPDYGSDKPMVIPWKIMLDCPAEGKGQRPDVAIVMTHGIGWEAWVRHQGTTNTFDATGGVPIDLPASPYRFRLKRTILSGRLVETYHTTQGRKGTAALLLESPDAKPHPVSVWLTPDKPRVVRLETGPATFTLTAEREPAGGHP